VPLAPGSRVGHYEIAVQIGRGGMGEGYRARDTKLNREVALKILRPEHLRQRKLQHASESHPASGGGPAGANLGEGVIRSVAAA
jgi:serine/threonine protein kinase